MDKASDKDGQTITMSEVEQQRVFDYVELARDPLYYNMCRVEKLAQQRVHKYPLGQRLWRVAGAGGNKYYIDKDDEKKRKKDRMVKPFFSYSLELGDHIRTGLVKINE